MSLTLSLDLILDLDFGLLKKSVMCLFAKGIGSLSFLASLFIYLLFGGADGFACLKMERSTVFGCGILTVSLDLLLGIAGVETEEGDGDGDGEGGGLEGGGGGEGRVG